MSEHNHDTHRAPLLFIADLHLDPARPRITELFLDFLAGEARAAQALYILGDLFEAWIGDDAVAADDSVLAGLRSLSGSGVAVLVMRGNRDFLLGENFAEAAGVTMLADPTLIAIDEEPVALMHGDSLCIDDVEYQRFRALVRDPAWQADFLARPLEERRLFASRARAESTDRNQSVKDYLMDVNQGAVEDAIRAHGVRRLIHGHTHRPAVHSLTVAGETAQRIVLGDWYEQGSVLRCRDGHYELDALPL